MPEPISTEGRDKFLTRCIPKVLDDGTAENQDQAVAICISMWNERDKAFDWQQSHWLTLLTKSSQKESSPLNKIMNMLSESGYNVSDLLTVIVAMSVAEFGTENTLHMIMSAVPAAQMLEDFNED